MPNNTTWLVLHVLCCIAQIGLVVAAAAAFAASFSGDTGQDDNTTHTLLPWTAFAIGSLGLMVNVALFERMYILDKRDSDTTNQSRYVKQKLLYIVAMAVNPLIIAADVAIAAVMGSKIAGGHDILAAPVTMAAIAGLTTLGTIFVDISQLRGKRAEAYPNRYGGIVGMDCSDSNGA